MYDYITSVKKNFTNKNNPKRQSYNKLNVFKGLIISINKSRSHFFNKATP